MTTDDFKQKCDEIHETLCYLDDNENVPSIDIHITSIWCGHGELEKQDAKTKTVIECAVLLMDNIRDLRKDDIDNDMFKSDNWTLK